MDLKDHIFGKRVESLTLAEAETAKGLIDSRGFAVHCLSTSLFGRAITEPRAAFIRDVAQLDSVIRVASVLRPQLVRLLVADAGANGSIRNVRCGSAWLLELYREAIVRLNDAGVMVTLENGREGCLVRGPEEAVELFTHLDGDVWFT